MGRRLLLALLAAVGVLALLAAAALAWVRTSLPPTSGERAVPGLRGAVEVWRDSLAVPHLWADELEDLLFAQGYVHAQDRLWQMELLRRVAEGRLAEVFGASALEADRSLRTLGLWRAAGTAEAALDPATAGWLRAYVGGVNAGIQDRGWRAPPPEFLLLRIRPEPWTLRHTLAIEKIMAMDLSLYGTSVALSRAVRRLGLEALPILVPGHPEWGPTIVDGSYPAGSQRGGARRDALPEGTRVTETDKSAVGAPGGAGEVTSRPPAGALGPAGSPPPAATGALVAAAMTSPPALPAVVAWLLESGSVVRASNSWVVGGEHSASGRPILANDMHLALRAPSLWHLMALHARSGPGRDGLHVVGMTIPGTPFVVAGHNRAVAWGYTNAMVDDLDFFVERLDPDDSTRYLTPGGSEPFLVTVDTIPARGREAPEFLTLRHTRHGPVVSDVDPGRAGDVVALRWVAHEPSSTYRALPAMNAAGAADELLRAVRLFDDPHQNVVYADTAGRFGYVMAGRVPVRANGAAPPLTPVPGWTGEWDWTGRLPPDSHPRIDRPAAGYVVTANNRQTGGAVADRVTSFWADPFRAQRITELIRGAVGRGERLDAAGVHRMQLDVGDARAARYRGVAEAAAVGAGLEGAASLLGEWDTRADVASVPAALFYAWLDELRGLLARDLYGGERGWFPQGAVDRSLELRSLPWRGSEGVDGFARLAERAMARADSAVAGRALGELHRVAAEHPLGTVAVLDRLLGLTVGGVPHGGSPTTVNVAQWPGGPFPKTTTYGPSQRHVVDLGTVDDEGGFIIPTGQSGNPLSAHYRDQFPQWRAGGLWRVPLDRQKAEARVVDRLRLVPRM